MKDKLGDRMKKYESTETQRFLQPGLPILVRIDGKAFHTYTKGMKKPFDETLVNAFIETTKKLVEKCNAVIGYTQSDEITLILPDDRDTMFERKIHKLDSVICSMATMYFNSFMPEDKRYATFDCRVWNVPNRSEAINCLIWRELDATKNAISMAASCFYSHKQLLNKNSKEKLEMLQLKGEKFDEYPVFFRRGTYIKKVLEERRFSKEEIEKLPPKHEARLNPDYCYLRSNYVQLDMPPLAKIQNRIDYVYYNEPYITDITSDKAFLKDFVYAYRWLFEHPIFNEQLESRMWITAVKVNPNTNEVDDDHNLNTDNRIWLEPQTYDDKEDTFYGDLDLECGGKTFEEAILRLANLVYQKYGTYTHDEAHQIMMERIARINSKTKEQDTTGDTK